MNPLSRLLLALLFLALPAWAVPPVISNQPTTYRTFSGEAIRLNLTIGSAFSEVSWTRNGVDLADQSSSTLVIPVATPGDSGIYRARVTNASGSTLSANIEVTISPEGSPIGSWEPVYPQTLPFPAEFLTHIGGRFVAGTTSGTIHLSGDGETWTHARVEQDPMRSNNILPVVSSILEHQGRFYAFAGNRSSSAVLPMGGWISDDLLEWRWEPALPTVRHAVSNGVLLLAERHLANNARSLASSPDGVTWENVAADSPVRFPMTITSFKGSFFVQTGAGSNVRWYESADGSNWTDRSSGLPPGFSAPEADRTHPEFQDHLVHVKDGKVWKSADGRVWTQETITPGMNGINPLAGHDFNRSFTGLGRYWLHDYFGNCFNSPNLRDWTFVRSISSSVRIGTAVAGSAEAVLAANRPGGIAITRDPLVHASHFPAGVSSEFERIQGMPDALFLTRRVASASVILGQDDWVDTNAPLAEIAFGNGIYVSRGSSRHGSFDGVRWTLTGPPQGMNSGVAFGNGRFVDTVRGFGSFSTSWSTDGTNWSPRQTNPAFESNQIRFAAGKFWVLSGPWGSTSAAGPFTYQMASSPDGESWNTHTVILPSRPDRNWFASTVISIGGRLILVTDHPAWWLVSDDDGDSWSRLDTGYGYLATSTSEVVIYQDWLVAPCRNGDIIISRDGRDFLRIDGPGGARGAAVSGGSIYISHAESAAGTFGSAVGVMRSGGARARRLKPSGWRKSSIHPVAKPPGSARSSPITRPATSSSFVSME